MSRSTVILGTRGSELALRQTELARQALEAAHPGLRCRIETIQTIGDQRTDIPLAEFAKSQVVDKGIFTKELENALAEGRIDLAVHSLKDVPTEIRPEFQLVGVLPREDTSDLLISRMPLPNGLADMRKGGTVATSAVRRQAQLRWLRADLQLAEIRGNVPTRLRKLKTEGLDALVLAAAGLLRLGYWDGQSKTMNFEGDNWQVTALGPPDFLPACGQGAIALESRANDQESASLARRISHEETWDRVSAERAFLALLQAGCHTPVGMITSLEGDEIIAHARVFDEAKPGDPPKEARARGPRRTPEGLAAKLREGLE